MKDDIRRLKKFFLLFRPHWFSYSVSTAIVACRNLAIVWLTAFISSRVVEVVSEGGNIDLVHELALFLLMVIGFVIFDTVGIYVQTTSIQKIGNSLRAHLYRSILRTGIPETERFGQRGELIARANSDVNTASSLLSYGLLVPVMYSISGIGATAVIARENWMVCAGLYLLGISGLFIQTKLSKRMRSTSAAIQEETTQGLSLYMQTTSQSADIRMSGLSDYVFAGFTRRMREFCRLSRRNGILSGVSGGFSELIYFIGFFGVIGVCLYLYSQGGMALAGVVMTSQMASLILRMVLSISSSISGVHASLVGIDRIFEVYDLPEESVDGTRFALPASDTETLPVSASDLACRFRNGKSAFEHLNMTVSDRTVALCGESGCGKTTTMRLLLKLYPYTSGSLKLFGHEVAECSVSSIRENIAYVPQENLIFSGTLRDNLLIGNPRSGVDDAEIRAVLEGVGADGWVYALERGLHTPLSEGGQNLSGGQRQMIAIARAILCRRAILILDEAFAGVDAEHIQRIMDYLRRLPETRSVLVITHDARVAECCDSKIVFKSTIDII